MGSSSTTRADSPFKTWIKICGVLMGLLLGYLAIVGVAASLIDNNVAAMVLANLATFALYVLWRYLRHRPTQTRSQVPAQTPGRLRGAQWLQLLALIALMWVAGQVMALTIYQLVGSETFDANATMQRGALAWAIALLLLAAPLAEEALIRGMVLPRLRTGMGVIGASIASAALFSLLHLNLVQIVLTLPMGILLGFVACYTGRIHETVLLHMAFNLLSVAVPAAMIVPFAHIAVAVPALAVCAWGVFMGRRVLT